MKKQSEMITWQNVNGDFHAVCGVYLLVVHVWQPLQTYEGVYYLNSDRTLVARVPDKPNADDAKNSLMDLVFAQIGKDVAAQSKTISEFWELKRSMERDKLCTDEKPDTRTVRELIDGGYVQVSSKYRTLARLPPGKTALEALDVRYPEHAQHVRKQCDNIARSRALCLLGQFDQVELTPAEFAEFKRLNGPVSR